MQVLLQTETNSATEIQTDAYTKFLPQEKQVQPKTGQMPGLSALRHITLLYSGLDSTNLDNRSGFSSQAQKVARIATFTNYILGMLLAVAINSKPVKLKQVWRTCFIIAIAIPQFVSLLLISRALEPAGAVNVLLQKLGLIDAPLPFLLNPMLARITVVVVNMWIGIPYTMMTFSGVLMNIPAELYESAEIDGAGPFRRFVSITLPYMLFVTAPATITTFVSNFNNFNVIYLLTAGGPFSLDYYQAGKTDLLVTWLYKLTVNRNDYSLASTIGIFIFLIVGSCSLLVYNRTSAVKKEDQFQ